jgi:hypothetical protein
MLRFNEDIGRLEVWRNDHWATILGESPSLGGGTGSNTGTGARGLLMGGNPAQNVIQYITIPTFGDSQDFGDLTNTPLTGGALSDRTRGIYAGGEAPARTNVIQFVTIASTGNASDFGDLSSGARAQGIGSVSDRTRGVLGGGYIAPAKTYVQRQRNFCWRKYSNLSKYYGIYNNINHRKRTRLWRFTNSNS